MELVGEFCGERCSGDDGIEVIKFEGVDWIELVEFGVVCDDYGLFGLSVCGVVYDCFVFVVIYEVVLGVNGIDCNDCEIEKMFFDGGNGFGIECCLVDWL